MINHFLISSNFFLDDIEVFLEVLLIRKWCWYSEWVGDITLTISLCLYRFCEQIFLFRSTLFGEDIAGVFHSSISLLTIPTSYENSDGRFVSSFYHLSEWSIKHWQITVKLCCSTSKFGHSVTYVGGRPYLASLFVIENFASTVHRRRGFHSSIWYPTSQLQ